MYIENKSEGLEGAGRIGWVELSRSRRSYHYSGCELLKCAGYKYNCIDVETGEYFWVSGPRRDGSDRLYGRGIVQIDENAREEYWLKIRNKPECVGQQSFRF
jgi:hypothetical protein